MNISDLEKYIDNPALIDSGGVKDLETLVREYPYFQIAHILLTKGLHNLNSIRYSAYVKVASCYAGDRTKLFNLIKTAKVETHARVEPIIEKETDSVLEKTDEVVAVEDSEDTNIQKQSGDDAGAEIAPETANEALAELLLQRLDEIKQAKEGVLSGDNTNVESENRLEDELLDFDYSDSLGFEEEYAKNEDTRLFQPQIMDYLSAVEITKDDSFFEIEETKEADNFNSKKLLIDKFLESNPRIRPKQEDNTLSDISDIIDDGVSESEFLSETLADIYIKQQNYDKALKIYQKLSLKYPQKSIYFADRISKVKELINNT